MSLCNRCGKPLPENSTVCPDCGEVPAPVATPAPADGKEFVLPQHKRRSTFLFFIPLILFVAAVIAIIIFATRGRVATRQTVNVFHSGLTPVCMADSAGAPKWGYMNDDGELALACEFDAAQPFGDNGLAAVKKGEEWGFINKSGTFVVDPKYENAKEFGENGYAPVKWNGAWGYINDEGKWVINPQFNDAFAFSDNGMARVEMESTYHGIEYGYINRKGVYVIEPRFENATDFDADGYAMVSVYGKWGMIDKKGEFVINPQFDEFHPFSENDRAMVVTDGRYGFIDRHAKYVVEAIYEKAYSFTENGLAAVKEEGGKFGFINEDGDWVIKPAYDVALPFAENGLAAVCVSAEKGLWGYINRAGKMMIEDKYLSAESFYCGLALVKDAEGFAFVEKDGDIAFRCKSNYARISSFSGDGYAVVDVETTPGVHMYGIIDKQGEPVGESYYVGLAEKILRLFEPLKYFSV